MEEISVVVKQEPGKIQWNFEDLKTFLSGKLEVYKKIVYDDTSIKTAKTDVAALRSLNKQIDDRRKEIKAKCLEPYEIIENQAKELTELINEPIEVINAQVQDYERRRKESVEAEIREFWDSKKKALPEDLQDKAFSMRLYDTRWLNATTTKKTWKEAIVNGIEEINRDIETIKSFKSEFEEDMLKVYSNKLSLQDAIWEKNSLDAQKQRVLELQKKQEEEKKAREEAAKTPDPEPEKISGNVPEIPEVKPVTCCAPPPIQEPVKVADMPAETEEPYCVLKIVGDPEKINKIASYIKFMGCKYQILEAKR